MKIFRFFFIPAFFEYFQNVVIFKILMIASEKSHLSDYNQFLFKNSFKVNKKCIFSSNKMRNSGNCMYDYACHVCNVMVSLRISHHDNLQPDTHTTWYTYMYVCVYLIYMQAFCLYECITWYTYKYFISMNVYIHGELVLSRYPTGNMATLRSRLIINSEGRSYFAFFEESSAAVCLTY